MKWPKREIKQNPKTSSKHREKENRNVNRESEKEKINYILEKLLTRMLRGIYLNLFIYKKKSLYFYINTETTKNYANRFFYSRPFYSRCINF